MKNVTQLMLDGYVGMLGFMFLLAAVSKLRPEPSFTATLDSLLGDWLRSHHAKITSMFGITELLAFILVVLVRTWMMSVVLLVIGGLILFAGIVGFGGRVSIPCNCFGNGKHNLGFRQVPFVVVVSLSALLPFVSTYTAASLAERFLLLGLVAAIAALIFVWRISLPYARMSGLRGRRTRYSLS